LKSWRIARADYKEKTRVIYPAICRKADEKTMDHGDLPE
jgi:hypothetical protein